SRRRKALPDQGCTARLQVDFWTQDEFRRYRYDEAEEALGLRHERRVTLMAKIVLGIGTSHGPMLSTPPDQWGQRVAADKRNTEHWYKGKAYTFDQLVAMRANEGLDKQITQQVWNERHAACRRAIGKLADIFAEAKPDIAVIVGNDQMEMFDDG